MHDPSQTRRSTEADAFISQGKILDRVLAQIRRNSLSRAPA
jgi:hypothetical protein